MTFSPSNPAPSLWASAPPPPASPRGPSWRSPCGPPSRPPPRHWHLLWHLQRPPAIAPPSTAPIPATVPPRANPPVAAVTSTKVIILSLGRREISLKNDGKLVGSWPVVIGAPETPTPTGTFKVQNKVLNPKYQSTSSGKINHTTGPSGPLGDRWMGFHSKGKNDFGIHGTPWPWWVDARAAVSHGCVRMKNEHVRVLFDQVEIGTPVVVKP
ncbi:L,D-transpeptidase [Cyanobium sp. ATX-6F1]|uniref:L,D-transpeptidase n=1 Tax=Cyanobium sp. ATX-6F1 TaxID=3137388 RepID=UPI0039BE928A